LALLHDSLGETCAKGKGNIAAVLPFGGRGGIACESSGVRFALVLLFVAGALDRGASSSVGGGKFEVGRLLNRGIADVDLFLNVVVRVDRVLGNVCFLEMRFVLLCLFGLDLLRRLLKVFSHLANLALLDFFALLSLIFNEFTSSFNTLTIVHIDDSLYTAVMALIGL
jgi:hypothetical protein